MHGANSGPPKLRGALHTALPDIASMLTILDSHSRAGLEKSPEDPCRHPPGRLSIRRATSSFQKVRAPDNCTCRAVLEVELTTPKLVQFWQFCGKPQVGWFRALNASTRKLKWNLLPIGNIRAKDRSRFLDASVLRELRGVFPKV